MTIEVRVPTLGESVTEATVATWFKKPGDTVAVDEMLCELETDKVTVEVPSPAAGVLGEIVAAEGETVGVDALLATIQAGEGAAPAPAKAETAPAAAPAASGGSVDVMVPTLGESVTEATVSTWFKKVGDTVAQDEMLCELETDKVSVEVPAPAAGVLAEILAPEGATVEANGKLAVISGAEAGAAPAAPAAAAPAPAAAATGKDVAGRFLVDGVVETATGTGRLLMGDADNENTADIQLLVTLTPSQVTTGVEGELSISRGVAAQMDQYLADFFDPVDGSLATINEDFDLRIESLDQSIERVKSITESKREFLVAQFAALERVLSDLQTTSGFLESQLSSLPSFGNQR